MAVRSLFAALLLGLSSLTVFAQDLGTSGNTFEIREHNAIDVMKDEVARRLGNGGQEKMIKEAYDRHIQALHNVPTPKGITPTRQASTRMVDLTHVVQETVRDEAGNIIVPRGMRINPLQVRPLTKRVFFIDANDRRQLDYVKANAAVNDKIIALAGSVLRAGEYLERHVYMDMGGLSHQMKIRSFPSVASQEGVQLRIEELRL